MKIGQIMRVKKGSEKACRSYERNNGSFVRVKAVFPSGNFVYEILNNKKEIVGICSVCFTAEDLEPLEKTLKTLDEPEKPEPKKMTVSEIAKALGHEVEVVKE